MDLELKSLDHREFPVDSGAMLQLHATRSNGVLRLEIREMVRGSPNVSVLNVITRLFEHQKMLLR